MAKQPDKSGAERRKQARFTSVNMVSYSEEDLEEGEEVTAEQFAEIMKDAETVEISTGGCSILTHDKLPMKTEFTFHLRFDDHVLSVRGKTVRARRQEDGRYRIGVQFLEMEPMERDGIALFLVESGADELPPPEPFEKT